MPRRWPAGCAPEAAAGRFVWQLVNQGSVANLLVDALPAPRQANRRGHVLAKRMAQAHPTGNAFPAGGEPEHWNCGYLQTFITDLLPIVAGIFPDHLSSRSDHAITSQRYCPRLPGKYQPGAD